MHHVGADFYPEHWPRERWDDYARWMNEAGFDVVRMAEFAWAFMEPEEGRFDFSLFDEALAVLHRHGIKAILGTPTAVMPAWVKDKYPECMQMEANGQRTVWGMRKNNCFTAGTYRLLSERVTRAMAEHFRDTPNLIAWQTDNEFTGNTCRCPTCQSEFRVWLRHRYGTVEALNQAWGTRFWGHLYSQWHEIGVPADIGSHNPAHCLDWQRFGTWLMVRFQRDQIRILREVCPRHIITHNLMGLHQELDYWQFAADLDVVSWDNYPTFCKPAIPYEASMAADLMRGLKRKNFWIMEQSAGPLGWGEFGRNVRPGELAKVAWQQVAHGADATIWFRWRSCTVGREQYWHGLLGHDGQPRRRYREAAVYAKQIRRVEAALDGTTVQAKVAMIHDYDSLWAVRIQKSFRAGDYQAALRRWYDALMRAGIQVDLVPANADLSGYRMILAPMLYVMPDELAQRLVAAVRGGAVLIADTRTGVKDVNSTCHDRCLPGLLSEALGIRIEEYEGLYEPAEFTYPLVGAGLLAGMNTTAEHYVDWIIPDGAEAIARYDHWHLRDYAAATRHRCGQGWGYYVGTVAKDVALYDRIVADALAKAGIAPVLAPPTGVEIGVRSGQGRSIVFVINHRDEPASVPVPAGKTDLLNGGTTSGAAIELPPYGVALFGW
jgi:beta-galactosidase